MGEWKGLGCTNACSSNLEHGEIVIFVLGESGIGDLGRKSEDMVFLSAHLYLPLVSRRLVFI